MAQPVRGNRVIVLDTETTGFSAANDRIVEVGAAEVDPRSGVARRSFHAVVDPLRPIPWGASKVHGLRDDDVRGKPHFGELAPSLLRFLDGATLAIHNSSFDVAMLDAELSRHGFASLAASGVAVVDTLAMSRELLPALERHSLDALCDALKVDRSGRQTHGALIDARLVGHALPKLALVYDTCFAGAAECTQDAGTPGRLLLRAVSELEAAPAEREPARTIALRDLARSVASGLRARWEAEFPCAHWACPHLATNRLNAGVSTSYADAARALVAPERLAAYASPARATYLEPNEAFVLDGRFADLAGRTRAFAYSAHALIDDIVLLDGLARQLETARAAVREDLLERARRGHALPFVTIETCETVRFDYKAALRDHAPDADLTPFRTNRAPVRVFRKRDFEGCARLFGPPLRRETAA